MFFKGFSRRRLAKIAAWSALGISASTAGAARQPAASAPNFRGGNPAAFPKDFLWGTATSSYQIEGAVNEDGRGLSIWDRFVHLPGKIIDRSTADVANDHYHRYKEDVQLIRELGAKAYRFSIAWPRVFPEGGGTPNAKGLDFYSRLIDELLANGIEPFATLYHWDLPQALQDRYGGWRSRDTAKAFADYAGYVTARISDRVKHIFTINECARLVQAGFGTGLDAPGLNLPQKEINQVRHHVALGHGLAVQAVRAHGRAGTKVGPAENVEVCIPAIETPANIRAAEIAARELNAGYLTVILEGKYTEAFLAYAGANAPSFTADDLKTISSPIDFVGINVYMPNQYVVAAEDGSPFRLLPFAPTYPHMDSNWLRIGPEAMYWGPRHVAKLWNVQSIYITENGTSAADQVTADGKVYDIDRIMYLRNYLSHLARATSEGLPIKGYFLWSLMDNFEWSDGYEKRFGLYHVNFETQRRTPKLSASFYREVIKRNAVV
ncbi:MAG TPA: GH1 family beta-glucosidase [Bradyrhizobium sp.]|uniref:GH1 family beta-glucosidase n=1 Tax=Bradyrhizobium sp. TaxID=376 RepID=UPI002D7E82A1|nr:GH1 family beta-glucosidase [Bradyrhizobium sp.]HET7887498.1 GH1 family beta-glucosidase [Bradyrhizobium sp.]